MPGESQSSPSTRTSDLYAQITQKILDMLDRGIVPWRSPILGQSATGIPQNLESRKPYRGINVFLLAITAFFKGYESHYWLTFNQARSLGGAVKKGEKATPVVFWKMYEVEDPQTHEVKRIPIAREYNVFNAVQCQGIEIPDAPAFPPNTFYPIERAELIVKGYRDGPAIERQGGRAYYRPRPDIVTLPEPHRFKTPEEQYSTLFHELSHSTGHPSRLARQLPDSIPPFGSPDYGKEELIAEMSAAFLCAHAGIAPAVIENQAAYLSGWLGKIRQDKKLLITAASAAQRSADWILGHQTPPDIDAPPPESPDSSSSSAPKPRQSLLIAAARDYLRAGYAPIPIPPGQKAPAFKNWLNLRLTEFDLPNAFKNASNLGLLLGPASGDLVDVDLDCPEARALADEYLPPTAAITGRPSSPRSHHWYICPNLQTVRHRDPITHASIVELRGQGSQTLVGPSIHPTGEPYEPLVGVPTPIDEQTLRAAVESLVTAVIRHRHPDLPTPKTPQPRPESSSPSETPSQDREKLLKRASSYLGAMPPAIAGRGGHNATYAAATALIHGFCLSEPQALTLLLNEYNPRCDPPWTEKELLHKLANAATKPHEKGRGWLEFSIII